MGRVYIKFNTKELITDSRQKATQNLFTETITNSFDKVLKAIIPGTNPDFGSRIAGVKQWILEIDEDNGTPTREIGLDDNGNVMMIMPWKDNYGFWTDSNIQFDDLTKSFETNFIDKKEFEEFWIAFESQNTNSKN